MGNDMIHDSLHQLHISTICKTKFHPYSYTELSRRGITTVNIYLCSSSYTN